MAAGCQYIHNGVRRTFGLAGLAVVLAFNASLHTERRIDRKISVKSSPAETTAKQRKIYPLSVIYGGAYSPEELNRARRLDSVVRTHYADFGEHAVIGQAPKDLFVYVSYRQADRVYWTKTKRRIPAGEPVLTDGKNLARTRCGNRLSLAPQQPTAPEKELSEEALNTPETPKVTVPLNSPALPDIEADLYVPAAPLSADLLPPPPFFSPVTPGSTNLPSPGGAYGPMWAPSASSPGGGVAPFFGGSGISSRSGAFHSETSSAVPVIADTPEPGTSKLLLISILLFAWLVSKARVQGRS